MKCAICGSSEGTEHVFREMMFGTRDEFPYWQCAGCGCLQIVQIPERIGDYYPNDYYSFDLDLHPLDRWFYRAYFKAPALGPLISRVRKDPYFADQKFQAVVEAKPKPGARILDVGCGAGKLVTVLKDVGFDALGIDPFAKEETPSIRRASLEQMEGGWDLIMFHHSLEHMTDHLTVLRTVRERLSPGGVCLVRIPVASWAWEHYGKDWVQLDAPRHLVIHTPESFRRAAELSGFQLKKTTFDSTIFQFYGSELYQKDTPLSQKDAAWAALSKETISRDTKRAIDLNRQQRGDQASFFLTARET